MIQDILVYLILAVVLLIIVRWVIQVIRGRKSACDTCPVQDKSGCNCSEPTQLQKHTAKKGSSELGEDEKIL